MSAQKGETLLFVGYAKLPGNLVSGLATDVLSLELEVDPNKNIIVDASISHLRSLGVKLILDVLIGYDLEKTLSGAEDEIQSRFFGHTQKAVIAALEKAYEGYLRRKNSMLQTEKSVKSLQD